MLIAGERDLKYVDVARRTAEAIPGSARVIIPGAGHTVHLEAFEAFADAIAAHWIASSELTTEASSRPYE
jgi:pimeloyl-ACP methyl ester carboxylesterase